MRSSACHATRFFAASSMVFVFLSTGCGTGGGSGSSKNVPLTLAQATAVATEVNGTLIAATAGIGSNICPTVGLKIGQEALCTINVATTVTCAGGGSVSFSGLATGDMDFTNTGQTVANVSAVAFNCAVAGTNLTMTGVPDVAISGAFDFAYGGTEFVNVTQTGSVEYGPSPAGSCPIALTTSAAFYGDARHTVKSCTLTGTACGQAINQSCM